MSVFDTPRVHFAGTAATSLPTGWNLGGSGHFWVDTTVVGCELVAGRTDATDPLVGRRLDLWGHYCEHLGSTANRARIFDVDPASNWTTTVMVGQLALGRLGRSHEVGYLVTGDVTGLCPPRWHNWAHTHRVRPDPLAAWLRHSVVYQFAVDGRRGVRWLAGAECSPALAALRELTRTGGADGLVVQFALTNMAAPTGDGEPNRWDLRGTLAPWRACELRTYPAGRLLRPPRPRRDRAGPHNLTVRVDQDRVGFNLITALPATAGEGREAGRADLGELWLRTGSGTVVATVPSQAYLGPAYRQVSGVLTVPRLDGGATNPAEPLLVTTGDGEVLLVEQQTVVQSDQACLFLEHPDARTGRHFPVRVAVRSYVRGEPAAVARIRVCQFVNPRGLPHAAAKAIAAVRAPAGPDCAAEGELATDRHGLGMLDLRGVRAGSARVLLLPDGDEPPTDPEAARAYDNDDALGYWSGVGSLAVRVLPDHWHLEDLPDEEITFDTLYREVFASYERRYSFMRNEVFSLADPCKVEAYARLSWHACDPRHRDKTYYMPPTRDLTAPQAHLLRRYALAVEAARQLPVELVATPRATPAITTRERLVDALRQAVAIELASMTQYLYAAYSIPTHHAGSRYVADGRWTPAQLRLACGDGPDTPRGGIRGDLLAVAKEEMIHFLVINNVIMAMGEPFHLPSLDFARFAAQTGVPLEFCLRRFDLASAQRFMDLERPHAAVPEVRGNRTAAGEQYRYGSLSELYAAIRDGLQRVPDAILVTRGTGGGEHHLFMRRSINAVHPDYQLEVDDVASAQFAIDFVTEHGEGGVLGAVQHDEESHFVTFQRIHRELARELASAHPAHEHPWSPSYPVLRNPTLGGDDLAKQPITHEPARLAASLFNRCYRLAMQLMVQHFGGSPDANSRRSRLMNWSLDLMVGALRPIAELLVTMPSGRPGHTAGPTFEIGRTLEYLPRPGAAATRLARELEQLAQLANKCDQLSPSVAALLTLTAADLRNRHAG